MMREGGNKSRAFEAGLSKLLCNPGHRQSEHAPPTHGAWPYGVLTQKCGGSRAGDIALQLAGGSGWACLAL
eukprot:3497666-Rhodomonas_salina.2